MIIQKNKAELAQTTNLIYTLYLAKPPEQIASLGSIITWLIYSEAYLASPEDHQLQ
jgi:hypothetical protein